MKTIKKLSDSITFITGVGFVVLAIISAQIICMPLSKAAAQQTCVHNNTGVACPQDDPCNNTTADKINECVQSNPIVKDLNGIVNFLSAGVGIVIVGVIILGGIQYATAGDSPDAVTKAKHRIVNALLAFAIFMFIYAFLQWLVPGGVFNK